MNWLAFFTNFGRQMQGTAENTYELADDIRRELVLGIVLGILWFLTLVGGHVILQLIVPGIFSPLNSLWGTFWVTLLLFATMMFGGVGVHALFAADFAGNKKAEEMVRLMVGFAIIATFTNMAFTLLPLKGSWALFLALPSMVGCYFLMRLMAGEHVNWKRWTKFPLLNIGVVVISILYNGREQYKQALPPDSFGWADSFNFSFKNIGLVMLVLAVVMWVFDKKENRQ